MSRVLAIEAWLHGVVLSPPSAGCISPRRRARSTVPSSPPVKRRRPLEPLAANTAVPMPRPPSPTKPSADTDRTPRAARRSPRKAARNTSRESAPPPLSLDFFDNTAYASALAAPPKHFLHSESLSRESSSVAGSSARSKRSVSPVKGIADLTFENGFRYIPADEADDIELGDDIDALCSRLADIEQGDGVVPDRVRPHIQTLPRRVRERFRERNYAPAAQDARSELYLVREFLDILELHRDSARHNGSAHSEAAWNDAVHSVVLRLALRETDGIIWSNVTAARIHPRHLVPRHNLHSLGNAIESKMVDYAISIAPTPAFTDNTLVPLLDAEAAALHSLTAIAPQSINQTTYPPLRYSPISISIETKTPDGNQSEAKAQLAVWGAAHLARLDRLRRAAASALPSWREGGDVSGPTTTTQQDDVGEGSVWHKGGVGGDDNVQSSGGPVTGRHRLPTLPLVLVAGVHWHLYFIMMDDEGHIVMVDGRPLGDTESLLGIYKLLSSLRALADLTRVLRAWLEDLAVAVAQSCI